MTELLDPDVERFIVEQIDTVPHLEALLLLHEDPARQWTPDDVAARLYVDRDAARALLEDLRRRRLAALQSSAPGATYQYDSAWDPDGALMNRVLDQYRRHLVSVASMIHAKPSAAIRDFARAFKFKKE